MSRLDQIKERLARLEKMLDPPRVPAFVPAILPTFAFPTCARCGLKLGSGMGYVCPDPCCPCGLGGATSCASPNPTGEPS